MVFDQIKKLVEEIVLFNETAGNKPSKELVELYEKLIDEESFETTVAGINFISDESSIDNVVQVLDGIADTFVVSVGLMFGSGLTVSQIATTILSVEVQSGADIIECAENTIAAKSLSMKNYQAASLCKLCFEQLDDEAFEIISEVNSSNLSKFAESEQQAIESVESYQNNAFYTNVRYKKVGELFVIIGDIGSNKPKILKSISCRKPELKQFAEKLVK